ncbi:c-type cytochrome [Cognatishimia sp. F0-27]|uniref:c-type cytochrome n=1 Tax=Cognatishimia sp. F0-27 TaxID=2816855 RepID=UPI001D0C8595|nr:c-type cytochrome [Cognatishimia sp. F0-27]MCC1491754.1 c-type cytochrome [Cognatishimia sp. F0-27]
MSKSLKLYGGSALAITIMLVGAANFADRNITDMPERAAKLTALPAPIPQPEAPVVVAEAPAAAEVAAPAADAGSGLLVAAAVADEAATGMRFGLGREAMAEEIAAWDVDVRPDGTGLPEGSGNAWDGEALFEENCAVCHGSFAEGVDNWPALAGGFGTLADKDPVKTVGSYWPYVSTVWDYVHRSMPFGNAQSLSDDDVYAIVAYILYSNDLIEDDFELSRDTILDVEMPNAEGFIVDDRAETEYTIWRTEPCMENCKDSVEITMRATVLDVTPEEDGADDAAGHSDAMAPAAETEAEAETVVAAVAADTDAQADAVVETVSAAIDPALVAEGEKVFRKCKACHQVGEGAKNRSGPHLNGVVGRTIGSVDGFKYSGAMADKGGIWDAETLAAFLADPRGSVKGTKMAFAGLKSDADIAAVTAYLASFDE